jgi:2-succinyl-5-enolpyruvyl-6-hydroxy-3-cyclohexene-1-carboxylate synthase
LLTGDLAFLHDLSGLLLTRRTKLPLTIVVLDDNGGGIFSMLPVAEQGCDVAFQELFHTPHDVDLERAAALYELDYHRATDASALEQALESALATEGVSMIHVPIDPKTNERRFREAVSSAVAVVEATLVASTEYCA